MSQAIIVDSYVFNPTAKTIKFNQYPSLQQEGIKLITNATTGVIIYQFNDSTKSGTVSGDTLTLTFNTASMSASDKLMIVYDPPKGGIFDRLTYLMWQAVEYIKAPPYSHLIVNANGSGPLQYIRAQLDTNSAINTINTITTLSTVSNVSTLSSMNGYNPADLFWSQWWTQYNTGIRSKIS